MERQIYNRFRNNFAGKSNSTITNSMGKCVSKQPSLVNLTESDFRAVKGIKRKFSEISDWTPICEQEDDDDEAYNYCEEENQKKDVGQSESKKNSKRAGPETKGTAMSFGFRKKIYSANNKKNANLLKEKEKEMDIKQHAYDEGQARQTSIVIGSSEAIQTASNAQISDKNGNEAVTDTSTKKKDVKRGPVLPHAKRETGSNVASYKGSRFGFRSSNIVRPASAGLTPKFTDFEENVENNNVTVTLEKRRSKSATGTHRLQTTDRHQFNEHHQLPQPRSSDSKNFCGPKIGTVTTTTMAATTFNNRSQWFLQQEKRNNTSDMHTTFATQSGYTRPAGQYTLVNTGMHTNVIVKPTPQPAAATVSKFTFHTTSLPKPQYPVPISLPPPPPPSSRTTMDTKNVKQVVNSSRRGFQGPREISTDSGISSLEANYDYHGKNSPSRSRSRNRPRNLQIVFNSRHKFDVRDLDDTLSCDSIEPLSLPKLPSVFSNDNQTVPLNGLVRSSDVSANQEKTQSDSRKTSRSHSDAESIEEEKLFRDRSTSEKNIKFQNPSMKDYNVSSKNSSPVSSRSSWCHAGETLAAKDCSSFSLSSSDDSKDNQNEKSPPKNSEDEATSITISEKPSLLSSLTTSSTKTEEKRNQQAAERPKTLGYIAETKFAEMAAAVSDILLDDETSPTDSLVSSTESDDAVLKKTKNKIKEDIQEKDIDEISPEFDLLSPKSLGTPTHASNSFSLSDVGRDFLIDDEIADQPALLFSDKADVTEANQIHNSLTETPTLIESNSIKSSVQQSKPNITSLLSSLDQFIRSTPKIKRRSMLLSKAESLDTLSPCESIASDDLMMDFDASSLDSFDRLSQSIKSHSGSALHDIDDLQLFQELDAKSGELIREWNNILRVHQTGKETINSQLPARATRLLNRSRIQSHLSTTGSDSPKSNDSLPHKHSRSSLSGRDGISSTDDLIFVDKSFRNSMIQDVQYFKKQLIRLRRILQDDEETLMRTETLNPFEQGNGQLFASCDFDSSQCGTDDKEQSSLTSSIADDPKQELADLRRQVVYLQGQLDDRDRTIRIQKNLIERMESERSTSSVATSISEKEVINSATQTDRVRPLSIGQDGLARSKPEFASYTTTHFPTTTAGADQSGRRHTVISTTFTNLNQIAPAYPSRRASLSLEKLTYKPVKTTLIGEPIKSLSPVKPSENSPIKKLTNGFSENGSSPIKLLTNGAQQAAVKTNCCTKKDVKFDDFKSDRRTQTITIV